MLPWVSDSFHARFPVSVKSVKSVFVRSGVGHNRPRQRDLRTLLISNSITAESVLLYSLRIENSPRIQPSLLSSRH